MTQNIIGIPEDENCQRGMWHCVWHAEWMGMRPIHVDALVQCNMYGLGFPVWQRFFAHTVEPYSRQLTADNSRTRIVAFCHNASPTSFRPPAAQIYTCRFDSEHPHLSVSRRVFTRPALELVQKEPSRIPCNSASRRGRLLSATPRSCCHLSLPGLNNFRTIK